MPLPRMAGNGARSNIASIPTPISAPSPAPTMAPPTAAPPHSASGFMRLPTPHPTLPSSAPAAVPARAPMIAPFFSESFDVGGEGVSSCPRASAAGMTEDARRAPVTGPGAGNEDNAAISPNDATKPTMAISYLSGDRQPLYSAGERPSAVAAASAKVQGLLHCFECARESSSEG